MKTWQQTRGPDPVQRQNSSEKIPEVLQPAAGGTDPTPRRIPLGSKSRVGTLTNLEKVEKSYPSSCSPTRSLPVEHQDNQQKRTPVSINAGGGATYGRCIPIPRRATARLVAMGTRLLDFSITVRMQGTGDRPMAACTRYSGDNLDTGAIHPSQQKMTKRQPTGIRPMATGTRHVDSSPRAETNPYLK